MHGQVFLREIWHLDIVAGQSFQFSFSSRAVFMSRATLIIYIRRRRKFLPEGILAQTVERGNNLFAPTPIKGFIVLAACAFKGSMEL